MYTNTYNGYIHCNGYTNDNGYVLIWAHGPMWPWTHCWAHMGSKTKWVPTQHGSLHRMGPYTFF